MNAFRIKNLEDKLFARSFEVINKNHPKDTFDADSFMKSAEAIEKACESRDANTSTK